MHETASPQSRYAVAGGLKLHYVESGSGPLILFLHGFPEFWYSWRRQIPALSAAGFHAVAVDLPGYNESDKPRALDAYRVTAVAETIAQLIRQLGAPCTLVGHDWGGLIAWLVAMREPALLRKLAVLNIPHPAALVREIRRSTRQKVNLLYQLFMQLPWLPEAALPLLLPRMLRKLGHFDGEELAAYRQAWNKPGAMRGMTNYYRALRRARGEIRSLMQPISIPTLLIWSQYEPIFLRSTTENLEDWISDLRVARVAGAGHWVQTDEPELVNDILLDFV